MRVLCLATKRGPSWWELACISDLLLVCLVPAKIIDYYVQVWHALEFYKSSTPPDHMGKVNVCCTAYAESMRVHTEVLFEMGAEISYSLSST